ncbi:MAG: hypothetical protein V3S46_04490 [Nitrospinota bacterium]
MACGGGSDGSSTDDSATNGGDGSSTDDSTQSDGSGQTGLFDQQCDGSGPVTFGASPLDVSDLMYIQPMGLVTGSHVTPVDHQYWTTVGVTNENWYTEPGKFAVYTPAAGYIIAIEKFEDYDYRVIIEHTCSIYTIFIHLGGLSDKVVSASEFTGGGDGGHSYSYNRISLSEGEAFATVGYQSFDFSVHDTDVTLTGFITPSLYTAEAWKIHTVDPFDYFPEPLRSQLIAKSLRSAEPLGGKIDYDISGRLVGNWFVENTNGYEGTNASAYWRTHLSVVYDYIDPSQVRVSIGDFGGTEVQYGVKGNAPDPADVSVASGVVTYELVSSDYYLGSSSELWDRATYAGNITARNNDADVRGVALFQMTEDNKLTAEFFPDQTASEITGFTQAAKIYER